MRVLQEELRMLSGKEEDEGEAAFAASLSPPPFTFRTPFGLALPRFRPADWSLRLETTNALAGLITC